MTVLALDLGTWTGVARGIPGEAPVMETWRMPAGDGEDVGAFAAAFAARLHAALDGVSLLVFEAPFLGPKMTKNMHTARRILGLCWECEKQAAERDVEVAECNLMTVRKEFAGNGRAEKFEVMAAAERRGFSVTDHHQADAVACWWFTILSTPEWRTHLDRYEPLLRRRA